MRPIVTSEEMRRADAAAIAAGAGVDGLMERAGRAVARTALRMCGRRYGAQIVVVCGPGNNGGDGYVAARLLRRAGAGVDCLAVSDPGALAGPAKTAYERFVATGERVRSFEERLLADADLIVDAIFGTGFHGEPRGSSRDAIAALERARSAPDSSPLVLSVDVPSGLGGTGPTVHSDLTLALGAEKIETAIRGAEATDAVEVADIGIAIPAGRRWIADPSDMAGLAERNFEAHKWSRSVAVLAGSDSMTGAAILASRAAFRAGAGYVTLATTAEVAAVARRFVPEAVVRVATAEATLGADALDELHDTLERAGAVAVGPGIGTGDSQAAMVRRLLSEVQQPVVLDADGLNVMAGDTEALRARQGPLVITPHAGELARLLDSSAEEIQKDRVGVVREAAERFGCTVLLKGPRTLVCNPRIGLVINPTGGPELATAGTGDVLSGVAVALASGGDDGFKPAWQAAYLHGYAAGLASRKRGEVGLVAWDVAEALPEAIAQLSAS